MNSLRHTCEHFRSHLFLSVRVYVCVCVCDNLRRGDRPLSTLVLCAYNTYERVRSHPYHMRDMTVWYVWHDPFIRLRWIYFKRDMSFSHVSCEYEWVTAHVTCHMSYKWVIAHVTCLVVPWLLHDAQNESFTSVPCLVHLAVCCSVLQCLAVPCSVLQCLAVCCSALQCVAVCCSVL